MGALALVLAAFAAHPLHTTLTQLAYGDGDRTLEVSVRVFADDFQAAMRHAVTEATAFSYLQSALALTDRAGRPLPVQWCGLRRTGDVVWLCLRAPLPDGLSGLGIQARQLFDLYGDQINIVQASYGGRRVSLLFCRGDPPKRLP